MTVENIETRQLVPVDAFKKPQAAAQIFNKYSAAQRKLLNLVFHDLHVLGVSTDTYEIVESRVREGIKSEKTKNLAWVKELARGLLTTITEWNVLHGDGSREWSAYALFKSTKIVSRADGSGWRFQFRLNEEAVDQIEAADAWSWFRYLAMGDLKRRHDIVIYEFLSNEIQQNDDSTNGCLIFSTDLLVLRKLLGLKPKEYKEFKIFNNRVLKPAQGEISKKTDIKYTYQPLKNGGRSVVAIQWVVEVKPEFYPPQLELDLPEPAKVVDASHSDLRPEQVQWCETLAEEGIDRDEAVRLVKNYPLEQIAANYAKVSRELRNGMTSSGNPIGNPAGHLRNAIAKNYAGSVETKSTAQKKHEDTTKQQREAAKSQELERKRQEQLKAAFDQHRSVRTAALFAELPEAVQQEKIDAVVMGDMTLMKMFRTKGFDAPIVKQTVFSAVRDELLSEPEETNFEAFCQWWEAEGVAATAQTA